LIAQRLRELGDSESQSTRVRAAIGLISLVTSGVAFADLLPCVPAIASALISQPSEAQSAAQLTQISRASSDYKSILRAVTVLAATLSAEIKAALAQHNAAVGGGGGDDGGGDSAPASAPGPAPGTPAGVSSVAQVTARIAPLVVFLELVAVSRYACDVAPVIAPLALLQRCLFVPGRQLQERASSALKLWCGVLPRADVRTFAIQNIKDVDAAAAVRDTTTMKAAIAALVSVVAAFPHSVPAFAPACLMKLVRYRNDAPITRGDADGSDAAASATTAAAAAAAAAATHFEDYRSVATEGLQAWWAAHLEEWDQEHKAAFTEAQAQAISDACKARSYFV
jgi:hypothetical protein